MGNRPMATGTQHMNFDPSAKINLYLKQARQMYKSLIIASKQRTNFGLMAVPQRTTMPRVVTEQQTNTYPQVISAADRL